MLPQEASIAFHDCSKRLMAFAPFNKSNSRQLQDATAAVVEATSIPSRPGYRGSVRQERPGLSPSTMCHHRTRARLMQLHRGGSQAPKLARWIGPALSSALSYALYNIFIKLGSASIHPILGGVILQFVAALLGTCLLGLSSSRGTVLTCDRIGILWSVGAGIAVGAAEILSFSVSGMGVEASKSMPIMIGGSIVFGALLGFAMLQERMTRRGWLGVLLVILGITCVATDPGAKVSAH